MVKSVGTAFKVYCPKEKKEVPICAEGVALKVPNPKARDVRATVWVGESGYEYLDVVIPAGPPADAEGFYTPECSWSVLSKPTHTSIRIMLKRGGFSVRRKPTPTYDEELAYLDSFLPSFDAFMQNLVDAVDPRGFPDQWLPLRITSNCDDSYLALIDPGVAREHPTLNPDELPKLYEYDYYKPQRVDVVPNTVHLPIYTNLGWMSRQVFCDAKDRQERN